jgi:DNA-binding transcriptional ArsR family regulator
VVALNAPVDKRFTVFARPKSAPSSLWNRSLFFFTLSGIQKNRLPKHYTLWCNLRVDQLSDVLTAISHPTRRAIIGQLANGPARFLDVAQPYSTALNAVTKHLKMLERAGLIERERHGREVLISLRAEPLRQVAGWVHEYERFWSERLDQFEQHFRDKKKEK